MIAIIKKKTLWGVEKMKKYLIDFIENIKTGKLEIYNEFSLQHELGIFLRNALPGYRVEFERNVSYFNISETVKKEIDIVIYKENDKGEKTDKYAIELKFPRNGQYPEQMYSFIKDIKFMEQLSGARFEKTYCLTLVDDNKFYSNNNLKTDGIYGYFRDKKQIAAKIERPTGNTGNFIELDKTYTITWEELENEKFEDWRYYFIEI